MHNLVSIVGSVNKLSNSTYYFNHTKILQICSFLLCIRPFQGLHRCLQSNVSQTWRNLKKLVWEAVKHLYNGQFIFMYSFATPPLPVVQSKSPEVLMLYII